MRLGEILIERRQITQEDLDRALELQRERGDKIGKILVDLGFVAQRDVCWRSPNSCKFPLLSIEGRPPSRPRSKRSRPASCANSAAFLSPSTIIRSRWPWPIRWISRPAPRWLPARGLTVRAGSRRNRKSSTPSTVITARPRKTKRKARLTQRSPYGEREDLEHLRDMASEAPVIRLVNAMIASAVEKRASDIHIEPFEKEFRVRYRIDGVLVNQDPPPRELKAAIISRVKLMAKLNIAERRLPQDGRIKIKTLGREVDLRVSTLPTLYGESVVMRLLDRSAGDFYDLERLGFDQHMLSRMEYYTSLPHGILLVTGPTGSGKSTTLYSALKRINQSDKKIITIEDPVEYQMDGINQIHVNPQIGLTFAAGLAPHRAPGSRRHHGRRNPRSRNCRYRHPLRAHRPFRVLHAAHQRRPQRDYASDRYGRGKLS